MSLEVTVINGTKNVMLGVDILTRLFDEIGSYTSLPGVDVDVGVGITLG